MSCTAQHGAQCIAAGTFKPVAIQLAVVLHMPNRRFDGTAARIIALSPRVTPRLCPERQICTCSTSTSLVAVINEDHFRYDVRQEGSLLQRFVQRVPIERIARHGTCPGPNRRFLKEHMHFCSECVHEDMKSWGTRPSLVRMIGVFSIHAERRRAQQILAELKNVSSPLHGVFWPDLVRPSFLCLAIKRSDADPLGFPGTNRE